MELTIKDLLELVLKAFKERLPYGICSVIHYDVDVSKDDKMRIFEYMYEHRPIKQYYDCHGTSSDDITQFWYKPHQPYHRIKWLEKHIKLNS